MNTNSHKTAITRRSLSAPTKYLMSQNLLKGTLLDFGCGKGYDCDHLKCEGYDPHYRPNKLLKNEYDTIFCNYVLNTLEEDMHPQVIQKIKSLLSSEGVAYISVRNDLANLNGFTKKGTYQTPVDLDLPLIYKTSSYKIYELRSLHN